MLFRGLLLILGVILLTHADDNVDEAINAALDSKNNAVADDAPKVRYFIRIFAIFLLLNLIFSHAIMETANVCLTISVKKVKLIRMGLIFWIFVSMKKMNASITLSNAVILVMLR
jgi:hypothetical protein